MATSAKRVAQALRLSERQVYRLYAEGMPASVAGARRWYDRRQAARRELEAARARKLAAEARLAELKLAKAEGELTAVADVDHELGAILDRLRARLLSVPGKYAPSFVGLRTIAEAMLVLERVVGEVMADLAQVADELDALADSAESSHTNAGA